MPQYLVIIIISYNHNYYYINRYMFNVYVYEYIWLSEMYIAKLVGMIYDYYEIPTIFAA